MFCDPSPDQAERIINPGFEIYFGNAFLTKNHLNKVFPGFRNLHQVHGADVVCASSKLVKADGQYSQRHKEPLLIKTADCMPVILTGTQGIIALHIGWRGLSKRILSRAIETSPFQGPWTLWLGPHLRQNNFELDRYCCDILLKGHTLSFHQAMDLGFVKKSYYQNNHFLFSMKNLLLREATQLGVRVFNDSGVNTYTSPRHYSYRRNRFTLGRNYTVALFKEH
ncbi:MAG: polyphenol oxidase family protein [Bdellovibrionales bacterium]|nr:polyphenol oxidase family protein [Bdellovibrionales bacterium]